MLRSIRPRGFTLIELLTVMVIILILAGLVLALVGFGQNKAARAKAEGEMAAISNALENYKTDNGAYPVSTDTDKLEPATTDTEPSDPKYILACITLYQALSGDSNGDGKTLTASQRGKTYYNIPASELKLDSSSNKNYIIDPFGNCYGYSTALQTDSNSSTPAPSPAPSPRGYNPTFDLWSTGGYGKNTRSYPADLTTASGKAALWIKNW